MDSEQYLSLSLSLSRIGLEPEDVSDTDLKTVERLQQTHITSVPFESLSVAGYPFRERQPDGVSLDVPDLYEKIVERDRGGICYELNGLFGWLLDECGFGVDRLAARVISPEDGTFGPPGDHQPLLVSLDNPYIVDVGFGGDVIRHPLPLDGMPQEGPEGAWRLVKSDRRDADYVAQSKGFSSDDWSDWFNIPNGATGHGVLRTCMRISPAISRRDFHGLGAGYDGDRQRSQDPDRRLIR